MPYVLVRSIQPLMMPRSPQRFAKSLAQVSLFSIGAVLNWSTALAQPVAVRAGIPDVTAADLLAATYPLSDGRREQALNSLESARAIAEEVAVTRVWEARRSKLYSPASPEVDYINYQRAVIAVKAGADIAERRAISALTPEVLEARAREIWLADNLTYRTGISVNVTTLLIDVGTRGYGESVKHWARLKRKIDSNPSSFDTIAAAQTDRPPVTGKSEPTAALPVTFDVSEDQAEGDLRKVVFYTLPVGQISEPISTARGWLVVRVNSRKPAAKAPFADVKSKIAEKILNDTSRAARDAFLLSLRDAPVEFVGRLAGGPDPTRPSMNVDVEKIVREAHERGETDPKAIEAAIKRATDAARTKAHTPSTPQN